MKQITDKIKVRIKDVLYIVTGLGGILIVSVCVSVFIE